MAITDMPQRNSYRTAIHDHARYSREILTVIPQQNRVNSTFGKNFKKIGRNLRLKG
jgi:hypothetical protein